MKWWYVEISTAAWGPHWPDAPNIKDGRDVGRWVHAADTKAAAYAAIKRLKLRKGELLHTVHVGPPKPTRLREFLAPTKVHKKET